ncbi:transcriptional regulator [Aliihoeflea sp. PC F10.4]
MNPRQLFIEKAEAAWSPAPEWVRLLAGEADRIGQPATAKLIDYSAATVSQVISNSYGGNLAKVEEMVRGALMGAVVDCPVLGEIGRNRCLIEQDEPFRATSAFRAQLYHACRSGCPHSRHGRN